MSKMGKSKNNVVESEYLCLHNNEVLITLFSWINIEFGFSNWDSSLSILLNILDFVLA